MSKPLILDLSYDINDITLKDLRIRKYPLFDLRKDTVHHINALDTETLDGYAKILCDDRGNVCEPQSVDDLLEFMTQRRYRSANNFFYNIRYDYQSILKYFDKDFLTGLYNTGKGEYQDYRIKYIPKRLFSITKNKHAHKYFDLAQFYEMSLESAALKYTPMVKNEDNLDRALIGTSQQYWDDNYDDIVKYCIQDAKITARLGVQLRDKLVDKVGLMPSSFISKAGLSKEYFRKTCTIPIIQKIPKGVLGIFLNAYSAGRFEVFRKGFIPNCVAVDINSAYSKAITLLPECTKGEWKKVVKYNPDALIGCYLVKIKSFNKIAGPHRMRVANGLIVYPIGEYYTYLTNWEMEVLKDDADIQVLRGWEYYDSNPIYPFKDRINMLYSLKSETPKSEYEYDLYKKIMNSLYGSFYEKREKDGVYITGKLFNPVYASLITGYCRMVVWKVIRDYVDYVVSVATDGIIMDKKPKIPYSKKLGDWSVEGSGEVVIIRSGLYRIGEKVRERGVMSLKGIKSKDKEYEDIFEYILDKPERKDYPIITNRPLNLGECLIHTKTKSLKDLNVFVDNKYTITINRDHKRLWDGEFKNGGELFEKEISSRPLLFN